MARTRTPGSVLIVGGGIAGIAAALRLAEAGVAVTLLETRKKLGGRATSFADQRSGLVLDNCQHVMLGCCTNFADFLERLGAAGMVRWYREQYWIEAGGEVSVLSPRLLPAPLHFGVAMMRAKFLTQADTRAIARASLAMLAMDRREHAHETFGTLLARLGQSERVVRRFWAPVVVSACNLGVERVAASSALHVFQEGFLANSHAADMGVPAVPLVQLYDRAAGAIVAAGGRVELGESVVHLDERSATTAEGVRHEADRVICALPVERVNRVVDAGVRAADARFAHLDEFTHSPILGVHLLFDKPVLELPHAVLVDRPTQWLFRKDEAGRSIHAVISAADDWVELTEAEIGARILEDIRACFPGARVGERGGSSVVSVRAVKERRATFAPTPGVEAWRPGAVGTSEIVLAGDYTRTGWPATMEGAARSGYAAAAAVLGVEEERMVLPPLRAAAISRALAGV